LSDGRFRGWFVNANDVAAIYGIFFLPVLAHELGKHRRGAAKWVYLVAIVLTGLQLLGSQSRAGIAAGIIAVAVLSIPKRTLPVRLLIAGVTGILVVAVLLNMPIRSQVQRLVLRNEEVFTGSGRIPVWGELWQNIQKKPLFGSGLGVSETTPAGSTTAFTSGDYIIQKGNSYVALVEELGVVGTALVLTLLLIPLLKACARGIRRSGQMGKEPNIALIAIILAGLANATFENWILSVGSTIGFSFWLFAELFIAHQEAQKA
jgi:O-antigen ligase